jgi:curved DNA-binding protein CbpA
MQDEPDYYKLLRIKPTATADDLRSQHRKLVRELHPDRHGGDPAYAERLTQINAAFHVLRDDLRRSAYDRRRREAAERSAKFRPKPSTDRGVRTGPAFRPMESRFTNKASLYASHPAAVKTRKRNALVGGIIAAVLGIAVICLFLAVSPFTGPNFSEFSRDTGMSTSDEQKQYTAIEATFAARMTTIQSAAKDTIAASDQDQDALKRNGDSYGAGLLEQEASALQEKIASVNVQITALSKLKPIADELKLQSQAQESMEDIVALDQQLGKEGQDLRRNSVDDDTTPSGDAVSNGGSTAAPPTEDNSGTAGAGIVQ